MKTKIALGLGLSMILSACSTSTTKNKNVVPKSQVEVNKLNEVRAPKRLATINFDFDSSKIIPKEQVELNDVIVKLKSTDAISEITIFGHADELGKPEYNYNLGLMRANNVKNKLILSGIDENLIKTVSFGEKQPLVDTKDKLEARANRRVTIDVIPKTLEYSSYLTPVSR